MKLNGAPLHLPDQPGVYLFRDRKGTVVYVGKAKSIRKRVASHFAKVSVPGSLGHQEMVAQVQHVECVIVSNEAEALLAEQSFIKQYRPRFNIKLRDDKSYPYIGISLEEDFPRVYFTRERHRPHRVYFGPYSNAKRVRSTLDLLGKVFMFRTCTGPTPGRRSGSPCLDYYIKRCEAPCVGYIDKQGYRASIDRVIDFLSGRYQEIERELERRMRLAAAAEDFEQAALERNRLQAVKSLLERQRVVGASIGTLDAIAVAAREDDGNAQVFQVRDGVLSDRQSFYLSNEGRRGIGEVIEAFMLQYYGSHTAIPAEIIVGSELLDIGESELRALREVLARRRSGPVEIRVAERGDKRRIFDLAARNAALALQTERLRVEHRRESRAKALEGLQRALKLASPPVRIECFDISNLRGTHTVASMVVFEGGVAKKSHYRRFAIRTVDDGDDYAAMEEVLSRRMGQWQGQQELSPHDGAYDSSFAALPSLVVIDGGKGQLAAGLRALRSFKEQGVAIVSLAKRIEEVFEPGKRAPLVLDHATPELQLLQRVRDEAHRFAISHHRIRRDKAMASSLLDEMPGIGPSRKRALLGHFGSPEAVLAASYDELQAVPGLPAKIGRELHARLHRIG